MRAPSQSAEQELAAIEEYKKELEAERADFEKEMNEVEARINELKTGLQGKGQSQKPLCGAHRLKWRARAFHGLAANCNACADLNLKAIFYSLKLANQP